MSVLSTTRPHADHFDGSKFDEKGTPIGPKRGRRPRKLKPVQRAEIYLLQVEIQQIERKVQRILDEADFAASKTTRQVQLRRIWRDKGT